MYACSSQAEVAGWKQLATGSQCNGFGTRYEHNIMYVLQGYHITIVSECD